jgi:tetratricopeptide (TPR) repeat protein
LEQLEKQFVEFVHQRAEQLAPGLDWEKPKLEDLTGGKSQRAAVSQKDREAESNPSSGKGPKEQPSKDPSDLTGILGLAAGAGGLEDWIARHPTNYYSLMERSREMLAKKEYESAKAPLKKLLELYPTQTGGESAYAMLAAAYRGLGDTNAEREVLERFAKQDDEAKDAYLRLAEINAWGGDWKSVSENVWRCLAVDPLSVTPYQLLAQASKKTGDNNQSILANSALLQLDPPNPAEVHFELAEALHRAGNPAAKRQVLQALEEAPRYRAALKLLLEINDARPPSNPGPRADNGTQ